MNIILLSGVMLLILFYILRTRSSSPKKNLLAKNRLRFVFLLYCSLLLISSAVVYALPQEEFFNAQKAEDQEQFTEANRIYDLIARGQIEDIPRVYKKEILAHELEDNTLELVLSANIDSEHELHSEHRIYQDVWIERTDSTDGKARVYSLISPSFINGLEFTERIIAPEVEQQGNRLIIIPHRTEVILARFEADFTATQFLEETPKPYTNMTAFGIQTIYIKIPQNVEVISNNGININYVQSTYRSEL